MSDASMPPTFEAMRKMQRLKDSATRHLNEMMNQSQSFGLQDLGGPLDPLAGLFGLPATKSPYWHGLEPVVEFTPKPNPWESVIVHEDVPRNEVWLIGPGGIKHLITGIGDPQEKKDAE